MKSKCLLAVSIFLLAVALLLPAWVAAPSSQAQTSGPGVYASGGSQFYGAPEASKTWYFSEGQTNEGYATELKIANPNNTKAEVTIDYYTSGGPAGSQSITVPGKQSKTVNAEDIVPVAPVVSAKVTSNLEVVVSRTMFSVDMVETNLGVNALATKHHFTEGQTQNFNMFLTLFNPGSESAQVTIRYIDVSRPGNIRENIDREHTLVPGTVQRLNMKDEIGSTASCSASVSSTKAIAVEQTYSSESNSITHKGMELMTGAQSAGKTWYVPARTTRGCTAFYERNGFRDMLLLLNEEAKEGEAMLEVFRDDGDSGEVPTGWAGSNRTNVFMDQIVGSDRNYAVRVTSEIPITCMGEFFFTNESDCLLGASKGMCGISALPSGSLNDSFYIPGCAISPGCEQWVGLSTFSNDPMNVTLKAYTPDGTKTLDYVVKGTRLVNLNEDLLPDVPSGEIYYLEATSTGDFLASGDVFYTPYNPEAPLPEGANYSLYFAEGTTRPGYSEYLCLQNPNQEGITVNATYMLKGADPVDRSYPVAADSRATIEVVSEIGPGYDVSVMLWSQDEFYAERPIYCIYKQGEDGYSWAVGQVTTAVSEPRSEWYFAEGTTRDDPVSGKYEEYLCVQNPNDTEALLGIDYIFTGEAPVHKEYPVPARSRETVVVKDEVGVGRDVSVHLSSNYPVVVERPMYFNASMEYPGGDTVMGVDAPKTSWYFAEGSTQEGFLEYLCVQNPNNIDAHLTVRFFKTGAGEQTEEYTVGANQRWTLPVADAVGPGVDSSVTIESDIPVVAERPMYFNYKEGDPNYSWTGGHDVVGAQEPKNTWSFAEGNTLDNFDEYICVGNPNDQRASIVFTFMLSTGEVLNPYQTEVEPYERKTVMIADIIGRGHNVSVTLEADIPVIAERPMYFNYSGGITGGHDAMGY